MAEKKLTGKIARDRIRMMEPPPPPEDRRRVSSARARERHLVRHHGRAWHHRRGRRLGAQADAGRLLHRRTRAHRPQHHAARACLRDGAPACQQDGRVRGAQPRAPRRCRRHRWRGRQSRTWAASRRRPASARARPARSSSAGSATSRIRAASATRYGRRGDARSPANGGSRPSRSTARSKSAHRVAPGDIVFADDTGVCFIPRARAAEVLELASQKAAAENAKCDAIDAGVPVADLPA